MAATDPKLVGEWVRSDHSACAADYAAHVRFEDRGLYFGTTEPPGGFTWWDGGTWEIVGSGQLAMSTANDAVVTYRYRVEGDALEVTDPSGCRFRYRRGS